MLFFLRPLIKPDRATLERRERYQLAERAGLFTKGRSLSLSELEALSHELNVSEIVPRVSGRLASPTSPYYRAQTLSQQQRRLIKIRKKVDKILAKAPPS
jgi:hypothetical protein